MIFGEYLADLRKEKNISLSEVAEKLVISSELVAKWEKGTAFPDIEQIIRLSELYGVSAERLLRTLYGNGSSIPLNSETVPKNKNNIVMIIVSGFMIVMFAFGVDFLSLFAMCEEYLAYYSSKFVMLIVPCVWFILLLKKDRKGKHK
ncbi:MAG: helix-turn-helix transcriptional regulator [Clostridia bacterium]|nr:helix-turn-helix transcriptional regulator [Clostridia bacterium]